MTEKELVIDLVDLLKKANEAEELFKKFIEAVEIVKEIVNSQQIK